MNNKVELDKENIKNDLVEWAKVIRDIITKRQEEDLMLRGMYERMNEIYKELV
jgi:hypothetical protein